MNSSRFASPVSGSRNACLATCSSSRRFSTRTVSWRINVAITRTAATNTTGRISASGHRCATAATTANGIGAYGSHMRVVGIVRLPAADRPRLTVADMVAAAAIISNPVTLLIIGKPPVG